MTCQEETVEANLVDIEGRHVQLAKIAWRDAMIISVRAKGPENPAKPYLIPGFVDAHVHIESSMLVPSEFARLAVRHGTVGAVCDPHEIANVLGLQGIRFMLENARRSPFHFAFGASPCVPATPFETAGARLGTSDLEILFREPEVLFLSEVMNYPGVLAGNAEILEKIALAKRLGYPVDGHAPGLMGEEARRYAAAGIDTDHECSTLEEAEDKLAAGMKILVREGSAARNFEALYPLIDRYPHQVMLCSDDKHPDDLQAGHIDRLVARAVAKGCDPFNVLRCACLTPLEHYRLPVGRLREGDEMDAVLVADLTDFRVLKTWLRGSLAAADGKSRLPRIRTHAVNRFDAAPVTPDTLRLPATSERIRIIEARDGELTTGSAVTEAKQQDGFWLPDPSRDLLQLSVVNRYRPAPPAGAFIRGFGLQRGAIVSSVAHDSHNLVGVGADLDALATAVNALVQCRGGIAVALSERRVETLPLPVAGLMSDADCDSVAERYKALDAMAKALGSPLQAPFMTLSFMALLVIPQLKLSDQGLFDGTTFGFVDVAA